MKPLLLKIVLPLTIISFAWFTKIWDVQVVDGTRETMVGFPFIYSCRCFHTSMCHQIFVMAFIADLLVYFMFWSSMVLGFNKYIFTIPTPKIVTRFLAATAGMALLCFVFVLVVLDSTYMLLRFFDIEVMGTTNNFYLL